MSLPLSPTTIENEDIKTPVLQNSNNFPNLEDSLADLEPIESEANPVIDTSKQDENDSNNDNRNKCYEDDEGGFTDTSDSSSEFPQVESDATGIVASSSTTLTVGARASVSSSTIPTSTTAGFPLFSPSPPRSSNIKRNFDVSYSKENVPSPPPSSTPGTPLLPPFYNRPPTPVPPSPSFASLIVPNTAPATPYASDDDVAAPITPTNPRVPTYEYYGFVLYLFSTVAFLIYLLWSFLPSPFLHALGIFYYPNRWWSLAIPSFLVMTVVYIYVALASYNLEVLTPELHDIETIVDDTAKVAVLDSRGRLVRASGSTELTHRYHGRGKKGKSSQRGAYADAEKTGLDAWCIGTDAVLDIPLGGVCEMLYAGNNWGAVDRMRETKYTQHRS